MQTNEELEDFMDKTAWTLDAEHHKAGEVNIFTMLKTLLRINLITKI